MLRTHEAGTLRAAHTGQTVTLTGWVAKRRDHGGVAFIDLRDASGIVQVVARDEVLTGGAHDLRSEYVVKVVGEVTARDERNVNPDLPTGEVEVVASRIEVLNASRAAALPGRRAGHRRRGGPPQAPLPRPAPPGRALGRARHPAALQGLRRGAPGARRSATSSRSRPPR